MHELGRDLLGLDRVAEVAALDKLHADEEELVARIPAVIHLHDVRVRECCHGIGFALEALFEVVVLPCPFREDLHRHRALQGHLQALVDCAHPSLSDEVLHDIRAPQHRLQFFGIRKLHGELRCTRLGARTLNPCVRRSGTRIRRSVGVRHDDPGLDRNRYSVIPAAF
jgi:hypothetical protein